MMLCLLFDDPFLTLRCNLVRLQTLQRGFPRLEAAVTLEETPLEVDTEPVTRSGASYLSLLCGHFMPQLIYKQSALFTST